MSQIIFPRTTVGGISLSRLIIGTNWIIGFSHTGPSADQMIRERFANSKAIVPLLEAHLEFGVDTIMAPFENAPHLLEAIREAE